MELAKLKAYVVQVSIHCFNNCGWLAAWLAGWLVGWLVGWLAGFILVAIVFFYLWCGRVSVNNKCFLLLLTMHF